MYKLQLKLKRLHNWKKILNFLFKTIKTIAIFFFKYNFWNIRFNTLKIFSEFFFIFHFKYELKNKLFSFTISKYCRNIFELK